MVPQECERAPSGVRLPRTSPLLISVVRGGRCSWLLLLFGVVDGVVGATYAIGSSHGMHLEMYNRVVKCTRLVRAASNSPSGPQDGSGELNYLSPALSYFHLILWEFILVHFFPAQFGYWPGKYSRASFVTFWAHCKRT